MTTRTTSGSHPTGGGGRSVRHYEIQSSTAPWSLTPHVEESEEASTIRSALSAMEALDVDISDSEINVGEVRLKHHIMRIQEGEVVGR